MKLGLIGFGSIGRELLRRLESLDLEQITLLVREGRENETCQSLARDHAKLASKVTVTTDFGGLQETDLVIEAAGHAAVAAYGPGLLASGTDLMIVSVGALADAKLHDRLNGMAASTGARIILPAGAIGGIDILSALSAAGDVSLRYIGTKPPRAWKGTPAERNCDLDALNEPLTFFSGTAREAATLFPKNANVAATLALAGPGFDRLQVTLIADPAATGNAHRYELTSPLATVSVDIANRASNGSAKTSQVTAYSLFREIRNRVAPVAI